jgi:hypothetical protein
LFSFVKESASIISLFTNLFSLKIIIMKKITSILSFVILFSLVLTAQTPDPIGPRFEYLKEVIELEKVYSDAVKPLKIEIEFTNTGDQPLIVSSARGCCGTRITSWTREPIRPGEKGVIVAEFTPSANPHRINRTITAISNDPQSTKIIRMQGEVVARAAGELQPAPQGQAPRPN